MKPTLLSIDFDFFPRVPASHEKLVGERDGERIESVAWTLFDWGQNEGWNPMVQAMAWETRAAGLRAAGLRIEEVMGITAANNCVSPQALVEQLRLAYDLDAPVAYAESHSQVAGFVLDLNGAHGPVDVLSFDAHHDLGYDPARLGKSIETMTATCEDWLNVCIEFGIVNQASIVFPPWLDYEEWGHGDIVAEVIGAERARLAAYGEWEPDDREIVGIFLCRSGSWVPPCFDPDFDALLNDLTQPESTPLLLGEPLLQRAWDEDRINHFATLYASDPTTTKE